MLKNILLVALGGAAGSVARYLLSRAVQGTMLSAFPFGTMTVNVLGCLMLGAVCGPADGGLGMSRGLRLMLTMGFCGGFTTFSTFMNESASLMRAGNALMAAAYIGASVMLGLLAVFLGMQLTKMI